MNKASMIAKQAAQESNVDSKIQMLQQLLQNAKRN